MRRISLTERIKKYLNEGKHEEAGVCPICGNTTLNYSETEIEGYSYGYRWTCERCESEGIEWYLMDYLESIAFTDEGDKSGYEEGKCPNCGSESIDYDVSEPEDNSLFYNFECSNCGCSGKEYYDLAFDRHMITKGPKTEKKVENKFNKRLGSEVKCIKSYVEDDEEYWSEGNIYNARKTNDGWKIQTNLGNWGRVGSDYMLDNFDEYFELMEKKTEGVQDDRLANSIKWLKDSGYSEYKTGDKYTLLVNDTKYDGQVVGAMFYGKSAKPAWHYRFKNMEELDDYTSKYLERKAGQEEVKQQWKDKRRLTKDHDIKVGDIFYTMWGYDQTNIDFYEVVAVRGSRIDLKELHQQYVGHEGNYDSVVPATGENRFKDDEIHTVSARADGTVTSLSSFEYPSKWDGKPKNQTDAYSGH